MLGERGRGEVAGEVLPLDKLIIGTGLERGLVMAGRWRSINAVGLSRGEGESRPPLFAGPPPPRGEARPLPPTPLDAVSARASSCLLLVPML